MTQPRKSGARAERSEGIRRSRTRGSIVGLVPLLSVAEVADYLRCSTQTVYRLIRDGELQAVHIGAGRGRLHVERHALFAYVKAASQRHNVS